MKSKIVLSSLFSAVMAVGASAQTTPPQTGSQDSQSKQEMRFTGCLQSADAARSGATATSGSSPSATGEGGAFVLINAKTGSGSATTGSSGTGSTGSATGSTASGSIPPSSSPAMARIKLEGSQSDLRKYANSQVEVRGTLDSKVSGSTGSAATGSAATGSTAGATGSTSGQDLATLRVTSVRQVASSCSGS